MNEFKEIREKVSIFQAAEMYGIKVSHSGMCCCPFHNEKTPSMKIYERDNKFNCFGCGEHGDVIDLTAKLHGISVYNAAKKLSQDFGLSGSYSRYTSVQTPYRKMPEIPKNNSQPENEVDYTDFFRSASQNIGQTDYHRGISQETLKKFQIGYVQNWRHPKAPLTVPTTPRLIIPTSEHSYLARDTRTNLSENDKKYAKSKVGKVSIFNESVFRTAKKPVFIVEGEIDALSIIDVGGEAAALGSISNVNSLLEKFSKVRPPQPIVVALDNDTAGEKGAERLKEGLRKLNIPFMEMQISAPYKDANEALNADREMFTAKVKTAENIGWLNNAKTVLTAYLNVLNKWENAYKNDIKNPLYSECQKNKKYTENLLSAFGGNEYRIIQSKADIERTAERLREIMKQGLHKIQPIKKTQAVTAEKLSEQPLNKSQKPNKMTMKGR